MHSINVKLFILFFLCAFISCDTTTDERMKVIVGTWYLQKAEADGVPTNRLDGTKYCFDHNTLSTNVPQIGKGNYSLHKDELTQKGEQTINYVVEKLDEKQMILKMTMRDIVFRMEFGRDSLIIE
jgi:hypothetical protein